MSRKLIFPILILILAMLACGAPDNGGDTISEAAPTPAESNVTVDSSPAENEPVMGGAATTLADAEMAVIHIIAEGSFVDPQEGMVTGGWSGTGFIIDPSGIAVTNNHVVTGAARIKVFFTGHEKEYNARVLGVSECSDLAVIDIDGDGFPYLDWYQGDIDIGLDVFSLGYPRGTESFTRNAGAVSKRPISLSTSWASVNTVVEHDALINPGNSGGPLVTEDAKVVAVNYSSNAQDSRYYGIAYSEAIPIIEKLQGGQDVDSMGINGQAASFTVGDVSGTGVWVSSVKSGSPADKAGVMGGDIIYELEGIQLSQQITMAEYCDVIRSRSNTDTMAMHVYRFPTGEVYEGQFNGRALALLGGGSTGAASDTEGVGGDTADAAGEAVPYFVEEFDGDVSNWTTFHTEGNESDYYIHADDGNLIFEIAEFSTYTYAYYGAYTYKDIRVDAEAVNRGANTNYTGIVCRVSDRGWYEFNINSSGLYQIWKVAGGYNLLRSGGSTSINQGRGEKNTYTAICAGDKLGLWVNGTELWTLSDAELDEGYAGVTVSSEDYKPVEVHFDWVAFSEP
jgi:S1-C subfamily serine protease